MRGTGTAGLSTATVEEFFSIDGGEEIAGGTLVGEYMFHRYEVIFVGIGLHSPVYLFAKFFPKGGIERI